MNDKRVPVNHLNLKLKNKKGSNNIQTDRKSK